MKIYLIDKTLSSKKILNLGGKIALDKLNKLLDAGNTVLIRNITGGTQSDFRIRRVAESRKMDRSCKTVKAHYLVNLEMGKQGFETFSPKEAGYEQTLRFHSLDRALNMLEAKQKLLRANWVLE